MRVSVLNDCLNSINNPYHLAQSPTFMNTCGQWAAKAYKEVLVDRGLTPADLSFVLVHDDLEQELGKVKILSWKKSPQGHNGVKSCHEFMQQSSFKGSEGRWHRIAVGIGRPQSRDAKTVAVTISDAQWEDALGTRDPNGSKKEEEMRVEDDLYVYGRYNR